MRIFIGLCSVVSFILMLRYCYLHNMFFFWIFLSVYLIFDYWYDEIKMQEVFTYMTFMRNINRKGFLL